MSTLSLDGATSPRDRTVQADPIVSTKTNPAATVEDVLEEAGANPGAVVEPRTLEESDVAAALSNLTQWRTALAPYSSAMLYEELVQRVRGEIASAFFGFDDEPFFSRVETYSNAHPEHAADIAKVLGAIARPTDALHRDVAAAAKLLKWSEEGPVPEPVYAVARATRMGSDGTLQFDRSPLESPGFADWLDTIESLGLDRMQYAEEALLTWRDGDARSTLLQAPEVARRAVDAATQAGIPLQLDAIAFVLRRNAFDAAAVADDVADLALLRNLRATPGAQPEAKRLMASTLADYPLELVRNMRSHWQPLFERIGETHGQEARSAVIRAVMKQWNATSGDEDAAALMLGARSTFDYWSAVLSGIETFGLPLSSTPAMVMLEKPALTDRIASVDTAQLDGFLTWYRNQFPNALALAKDPVASLFDRLVSDANGEGSYRRFERALIAFEFREVARASAARFPGMEPALLHSGSAAQLQVLEDLSETLPPTAELTGVADWLTHQASEEQLRTISASFRAGQAQALAESLVESWGYSELSATEFFVALGHEVSRRFFLDPSNARSFHTYRVTHDLPGDSFSEALGLYRGHVQFSENPEIDRGIKEALGNILTMPFARAVLENAELLAQPWFDAGLDGQLSANMLHRGFESIESGDMALGEALYSLGAQPMRHLVDKTVRARRDFLLLEDTQRLIEQLAESLWDASPIDTSVNAIALLQPSAESVQAYVEFVGKGRAFDPAVLRALGDPSVRAAVADPEFSALLGRLEASGLPTELLSTRVALAEYYETLRALPDDVLANNVERSKRIAERLGITEIPPQMVATLVSGDFGVELEDLQPWIQRFTDEGVALSPNDLPLLVELTREPELARRAASREWLVARLRSAYALHPPFERPALSPESRPTSNTERPEPGELDTLNLVRTSLWLDALESDDFLSQVGRIVSADLADKSTERGGFAPWRNGRLALDSITSRGLANGSFVHSIDTRFHGGITSFHLHAVGLDNSAFSGPSGDLESSGGDVAFVREKHATDVVLTVMGHPIVNGAEDTSRVRVNFDLYYVDEYPEPTLRVVDLGERWVPFTQ